MSERRGHRAYAFRSDLSLDGMQARVSSTKGMTWEGGDNDVWGDYLWALFDDRTGMIRIFVDGSRYVVDVSRAIGTPDWQAAHDYVESTLLPLVGARDIEPHPGWEG